MCEGYSTDTLTGHKNFWEKGPVYLILDITQWKTEIEILFFVFLTEIKNEPLILLAMIYLIQPRDWYWHGTYRPLRYECLFVLSGW